MKGESSLSVPLLYRLRPLLFAGELASVIPALKPFFPELLSGDIDARLERREMTFVLYKLTRSSTFYFA